MDPSPAAADQPKPSPSWAIVIHGGAGGDPAKYDNARIEKKKLGLKRALQAGCDALSAGESSIDTVEKVIRILEDDAAFNAGRGAVLTDEGRAELDASIMNGRTLACGGVAGVTRVKNPISLARRVMTETRHVLLAGEGADEFAEEQGLPIVDPSYFLSQAARRKKAEENDGNASQIGTVGCVVLDSAGNLAAGTSTGGTSKKLPGRVGDSPIIGAGTYASNDTCAVSGTGTGEEYIRHSVAYDIAAQMRYAGQTLESAVTEIMQDRLEPGVGGVIAVSSSGAIVMQHNTPGMSCGAADSQGRFETHLFLEAGGAPDPGSGVGNASATVRAELTRLIQQQARDWNAGDIDAFMKPYWKSDELTFSSGGNVTRGFDATLARYKQRYPTTDAMGKLTFNDFEFLSLDNSAMQVLGVWQLDRRADPIGGRFTLILRRFPEGEGWKIVHDHTSAWDQDSEDQ